MLTTILCFTLALPFLVVALVMATISGICTLIVEACTMVINSLGDLGMGV